MKFGRSMKFFYFISFLALMLFAFGHAEEVQDVRSHYVVASVAPYKFFVEAIADNTIKIGLLVPTGASFHTYEPTPKQVLLASNADLWFRIGESFENRALQALKGHNSRMRVVDLRQGVDLITVDPRGHRGCCHAGGADLHIWLSPRQAKIQVKAIAQALIEMYPEHQKEYQQRLDHLLIDLDALDQEISHILAPLQNRTLMVSHAAYAYFSRDYNLKQLPIEIEGKDPSPRQLNTILNEARQAKVKTIFTQKQYSSKGAQLIAKELGGHVVELDPYSEDYFDSMRNIARHIAAQENSSPEKANP